MPERREVLRLEGLRKSYNIGQPNEVEVLHGLDLRLDSADFAALVGPSGSGKSTLLNQIGLLDSPTAGELYLLGCQVNPLRTASTHVSPDAARIKKLLMKKDEIKRLVGKVEQKGYTLVPINLHWKNGLVKCDIALAKGKAEHDKRDTIKDREGKREVERAMKSRHR